MEKAMTDPKDRGQPVSMITLRKSLFEQLYFSAWKRVGARPEMLQAEDIRERVQETAFIPCRGAMSLD